MKSRELADTHEGIRCYRYQDIQERSLTVGKIQVHKESTKGTMKCNDP